MASSSTRTGYPVRGRPGTRRSPERRASTPTQRGPWRRDRGRAFVLAGQGDLEVRSSARSSARPCPHSTTVTRVLQRRVEVEVVELGEPAEPVGVDVDERRPATSDGWTRAMTKVGEVIGPRTPRPSPMPWVERRLAGAEAAGEHDEVAGPQQPGRAAHPRPGCPSAVGSRWASAYGSLVRRPARRRGGAAFAAAAQPGEVGEVPLDARLAERRPDAPAAARCRAGARSRSCSLTTSGCSSMMM